MATITQTEPGISPSRIKEIEERIGLNFPTEYMDHLLKYNGGRCDPNIFSFIENGAATESCVDWFLAIYEGEYDNLESYIDMYKLEEKRMPFHVLPIAHDPGGNLICISCSGNDIGHVYFWDHEREVNYKNSNDEDYSNLYFIANSFDKFLDLLRRLPMN